MTGRLEGLRVLNTRPRERSLELCFLLEDEGATVLSLPLLELLPPEDERPLRSAAELLPRYAWVLFTSPSAVQALQGAAREAGTLGSLARVRIGVVGPATARAARAHGLSPEVEATETTGGGLAEALEGKLAAGDEVLLPVAQDARRELHEALDKAGVLVTRVVAYRSEPAALSPEAWAEVCRAPPEVVLFASPRTVEAFLQGAGPDGERLLQAARRVAIGPTTAGALERLGYPAAAVAEQPTAAGLVEAAVQAARR